MNTIKIGMSNVTLLAPVAGKWFGETKTVLPISHKDGVEQITTWARDPDVGLFGLMDGDKCVGMLACHVHGYPATKVKVVSEYCWFVVPEYRGNGGLLLDAMEEWGKARGAQAVVANIMLSIGGDNGERACGALKKLGFTEFERAFYRFVK